MEHTIQIEESVVELSLDWLLGEVCIQHHDHPYLIIRQTTNQVFPKRYLMHHQVKDGRLFIQDRRKKYSALGFNFIKLMSLFFSLNNNYSPFPFVVKEQIFRQRD